MLAKTRKTAEDLGLSEPQRAALELVLTLLRTGGLVHERLHPGYNPEAPARGLSPAIEIPDVIMFNMADWSSRTECGTVACIGGSAERLRGVSFPGHLHTPELNWLFYPEDGPDGISYGVEYSTITTAQAADALELYLSTGSPCWNVVLGITPYLGAS